MTLLLTFFLLAQIAVLVALYAQRCRAVYCARSIEAFVNFELHLDRMSRYQRDVLLGIAEDLKR